MTTFEKAFWSIKGDNISIGVPIQKVDSEKRIVSGWATTDSLDKQGDIVDIAASEKAFENFRGNIREMHQPVAVGKVVSFKRDTYFDKASGKLRNGIFVDVYVSKGAQDTWHKVTEGILTAFSIGGVIKDAEQVYQEGVDHPIRFVKNYDLTELSLVDNPANDDANFVSIQKFNSTAELEKNYLENVYWCNTNDTVIVSEKSDYSCPQCDKRMTNIGFVESNDVDKSATINSLLEAMTKVESPVSDAASENEAVDIVAKSIANENEKEGNIMGFLNKRVTVTEEFDKFADEAIEVSKSEEVVETGEVAEEVIEKSAEEVVEEATTEDAVVADETLVENSEEAVADEEVVEKSTAPAEGNDDLAKAVSEINAFVVDAIGELVTTVKSLAEEVASLRKSTSEEVAAVKSEVEKFGERVESVEADTAVRKSGDLGGIVQEQVTQKSMWGGRFLKAADLYR